MEQQSMFEREDAQPLAARLRPETLEDYVGQQHLLGPGKVLRRLIEDDHITSMIFWGPPGVGKTTLARIIAKHTKAEFIDFSAVTSGIREIRSVMKQAEENRRFGERTIVFVDEIHRFNKAQQDAFLPFVEKGSIILIGATTENPSFEVNGALLSRCKVFVLQPLQAADLVELLSRALQDPRGFGNQEVEIAPELLEMIASFANGDARTALSTLEMVVLNGEVQVADPKPTETLVGRKQSMKTMGSEKSPDTDAQSTVGVSQEGEKIAVLQPRMGAFRRDEPDGFTTEGGDRERIVISRETVEQCVSKKSLLYDKNGEEHYNLISALHKSMRNSDPDAAVYWLARMLEAGEDPLYVARRVTRFASEDIGLADPRALEIAVAAYQACHLIGMPECAVHLTEAVVYLSLVPKSNALYRAYEMAKQDALTQLSEPVPFVIRNAPTQLMKDLEYGKGYQYAHDTEEKLTDMQCLPDSLLDREYYRPTDQGQEGKFKTRLEQIREWKRRRRKKK